MYEKGIDEKVTEATIKRLKGATARLFTSSQFICVGCYYAEARKEDKFYPCEACIYLDIKMEQIPKTVLQEVTEDKLLELKKSNKTCVLYTLDNDDRCLPCIYNDKSRLVGNTSPCNCCTWAKEYR